MHDHSLLLKHHKAQFPCRKFLVFYSSIQSVTSDLAIEIPWFFLSFVPLCGTFYLNICNLAPFSPSWLSELTMCRNLFSSYYLVTCYNSAQCLFCLSNITWFYQVTNHISSISNVFVHDGTIGSSPKCDAKVRVISDSPSAVLSLSNVFWKTPTRAVSHDSCPLTVYVATSIRYSLPVFIHILLCYTCSQ